MKKKVLVVGSGLAGSLLCDELCKVHDVTLLEKGPQNSIAYPQFNFHRKKLAKVHTCCYGSGGSTNLWHNGLIPIRGEDVVGSEFREVLQKAGPYTDQTAEALFYTNAYFAEDHRQLVNEANMLSPDLKNFCYGIDCLVYPKKYQKLTVSPAVQAIYEVEDIDFICQNDCICKVNYR